MTIAYRSTCYFFYALPPQHFQDILYRRTWNKDKIENKKLGYSGAEKAVICSLTLTEKHRRYKYWGKYIKYSMQSAKNTKQHECEYLQCIFWHQVINLPDHRE
jgi:hypothetical protein